MKSSTLIVATAFLAAFFGCSEAYRCYACSSSDPSNAKMPDGSFYEGGYTYLDIEGYEKMVPWQDWFKVCHFQFLASFFFIFFQL